MRLTLLPLRVFLVKKYFVLLYARAKQGSKYQSSPLQSNTKLHDLYKDIPINTAIFNYFKKAVAISVNIEYSPRNI